MELVDEDMADAGAIPDAVLGRRKVVAPGSELAGGKRATYGPWAGDLRAGERQARIDYRSEHAAILSRPDCYD